MGSVARIRTTWLDEWFGFFTIRATSFYSDIAEIDLEWLEWLESGGGGVAHVRARGANYKQTLTRVLLRLRACATLGGKIRTIRATRGLTNRYCYGNGWLRSEIGSDHSSHELSHTALLAEVQP